MVRSYKIRNARLILYLALATLPMAARIASASTPEFASKLNAGSSTIFFTGDKDSTITVYQFGVEYPPVPGVDRCDKDALAFGTILTAAASGTNQAALTSTKLTADGTQSITLSQPLVAGVRLCLVEKSTGDPTFSKFQLVINPTDFGRFQMGFTGGVMISNQQQTSNSSTASQYLDVGLAYTWARAHRLSPGLSTFLNARLTSLPVATTTTTASTTGTTPTLSQSLNVLSSQQSARILIGAYLPFRTTRFAKRSNYFTIAPLLKAGFDTLLNPTVSSSTTPSTGTTSITTGNFSSVYSMFAAGTRVGWETYPLSTDEAPQTNTWISFVIGNYSNLPSFVCTSSKFYVAPAKPDTACNTQAVTSGTSTTYNVFVSRKLIPRIEIAGEARIPNYPFVLGLDANLSQYDKGLGADHIDIFNKAGNDVRLYVGFKLDLASAFKKLGAPSQ